MPDQRLVRPGSDAQLCDLPVPGGLQAVLAEADRQSRALSQEVSPPACGLSQLGDRHGFLVCCEPPATGVPGRDPSNLRGTESVSFSASHQHRIEHRFDQRWLSVRLGDLAASRQPSRKPPAGAEPLPCGNVTVMPLPISKSALDRLGRRMAAGDHVENDDLELFALVASACQEAADQVRAQLAVLGYDATPRVKSTGTLVDKLRRQHTRLSQVQDLAGARFVVRDRSAQDSAVSVICERFEATGCPCKVDDLREDDSYGYRAVHVIVQVGGIPVEVQVRTELQDSWAQIVEDLGDRWGRGIRYGQGPENPDATIQVAGRAFSRRQAMESLKVLSDYIDGVEHAHAGVQKLLPVFNEMGGRMREAWVEIPQLGIADDVPLSEVPSGDREDLMSLGEAVERLQGNRRELAEDWRDWPFGEFMAAVQRVWVQKQKQVEDANEALRNSATQLQRMLQVIAEATDDDDQG